MKKKTLAGFAAAAAMVAALPAEAHTLGASGAGLADGALHPLGGFDHLLAMVAVGLWAGHSGGRSVWLVPAAFIGAMAAGALLGAGGFGLPLVELGIAASVALLGVLLLAGLRLSPGWATALAGAAALFHGHAHGSEMPVAAAPLLYGLGFVAVTALLHGAGVLMARSVRRPAVIRACGAGVAAAGLVLVAGV